MTCVNLPLTLFSSAAVAEELVLIFTETDVLHLFLTPVPPDLNSYIMPVLRLEIL